jgi:hypothetical protein
VWVAELPELVVPSEIPWGDFIGEELEELLYWLCDALGAQALDWRAGSVSGTSTDGGRDLEATFHVPLPDGEIRPERWWLQAKGRSATVERAAVQQAVLDASANAAIGTLVIATNSRFSNPTRDWVSERMGAHPRPRIILWDRDALERMVIRHPSVVARVAPGALSDVGRLAAVTSRFWDRTRLPTEPDLVHLWRVRSRLQLGWRSVIALTAGEVSHGDARARSWPLVLDENGLAEALVLGLINLPYLLIRAEPQGTSWVPLTGAMRYVLGCSLLRLDPETVADLIDDPWRHIGEDDGPPAEVRREAAEKILMPVVREFQAELGDVCSTDCVRVSADATVLRPDLADATYWDRYIPETEGPAPPAHIWELEKQDEPCVVGFELDAERMCPLYAEHTDLVSALAQYRRVLDTRVSARRAALDLGG